MEARKYSKYLNLGIFLKLKPISTNFFMIM